MEHENKKIIKTYYSIIILDSCGDEYEEVFKNQLNKPFTDLKDTALRVLEMKKTDKELGAEYGTWDYRICKHEEDDDTDYQTIYKLYKYAKKWKIKVDYDY